MAKNLYSPEALAQWRDRCLAWKAAKKSVYVCFDNDEKAYAATDAQNLARLIKPKPASPRNSTPQAGAV